MEEREIVRGMEGEREGESKREREGGGSVERKRR